MRSRSKGHAAVGGGSAFVGTVLIVAGLVRPPFATGALLETPVWALVITAGCVLALTGAFILVFAFRAPPQQADVVPAYVAFQSRMTAQPIAPPPLPAPRRVPPGAQSRPSGSAPKLQPPPGPAQQRVGPSQSDVDGLAAQIHELTKKINKAGVMLATGQLSQEGYLAYVDDLKRQRGNLEAARVRAELRTT